MRRCSSSRTGRAATRRIRVAEVEAGGAAGEDAVGVVDDGFAAGGGGAVGTAAAAGGAAGNGACCIGGGGGGVCGGGGGDCATFDVVVEAFDDVAGGCGFF
jgi:hypothetical protein